MYEHKIIYFKMPEDIETESDLYNEILVKEMDSWGKSGWECYQCNSLMSGEKIRLYFKRKKETKR